MLVKFFTCVSLCATSAVSSQNGGWLLKSTLTSSESKSSSSVVTSNGNYSVIQSIGQLGIQGTVATSGSVVQQGFLNYLFFEGSPEITNPIVDDIELILYPNTVANILNIDFSKEIDKPIYVGIFDLLGSLLMTERFFEKNDRKVALGHLQEATYIVRVVEGKRQWSRKIIRRNR